MKTSSMTRRDFTRMAAAALGGVVAGSALSGCSNNAPAPVAAKVAAAEEMHACKGLNGCKGQGAGGMNACAGQGGCASAAMEHECKGHNACKGQGGCGEMPGMNDCKGHGGCAVPMKDENAWKKAREVFETKMKEQGKTAGNPPA